MSTSELAQALGKTVSGLYIISLKDKDKEAGFLASWVQQAGFKPPMLTIAFNKERKNHFQLLTTNGKLVVNIMSKENGKTMSRFFKPAPAEGSIFDELETITDITGVPILKDCVAYLECKYHSEMQSEDHIIVMVEVINGKVLHDKQEPSVHIRKDGLSY
jgi:3-hydroxy-9,10-secoandrosta-1,3,5(10)-triene-9,17-dione monooxygenase reductase component